MFSFFLFFLPPSLPSFSFLSFFFFLPSFSYFAGNLLENAFNTCMKKEANRLDWIEGEVKPCCRPHKASVRPWEL